MSTTRGAFLAAAGGFGLGLVATLEGCAHWTGSTAAPTQTPTAVTFVPNAWLRIGGDDRITVIVSKSEMGQGIATGFATILADELDASLERVTIEFAPVRKAYDDPAFGSMTTGGSTSTPDMWLPLRTAGATARAMLVSAAAQLWSVPAAECTTAAGVVTHVASGGRATYGDLVELAATLPVPRHVALKEPSAFTLIGKPGVRRLDLPAKVDGRAKYGIDVVVPHMVYASVERPPDFGGTVRSFDGAKAKAVPGVIAVVRIGSGIAVVGTNTYAAFAGRRALAVRWHPGPNAGLTSHALAEHARALVPAAKVALHLGNAATVASGASHAATFEGPFLAHATMEPQNATADVRADGCDVWAPTQVQTRSLEHARRITGLPAAKINIHTTLLGGGFGRRLDADYVVDAVETSKAIGKPVKVTWTREDDIRHDFYRPSSVNALRATLTPSGTIASLEHTVVAPSVLRRWLPSAYKHGIDTAALDGAINQPYAIANVVVRYADPEHAIPVGFMRAPAANFNTFALESFVDELAHAANKDPADFRRAMLGHNPRMAGVLDAVVRQARYDAGAPSGRAYGLALCFWGGSYGALVADVSMDGRQPVVHRVTMAVDCGRVVNPDTVEAQVQGAVNYGLAMARNATITIHNGAVVQGNFDDYQVLRNVDAPHIDVVQVASTEKPTGIGELGTPPIAPAIANAVFALTGRRARVLPFSAAYRMTAAEREHSA